MLFQAGETKNAASASSVMSVAGKKTDTNTKNMPC